MDFLTQQKSYNRYFGIYPAIVVDNVDPEQRYRVKVKFPWLMESDAKYVDVADKEEMRSSWARVASPMMGTNAHSGTLTDELRGWFALPEKDDEVLVMFAFGDFREAIVVGQMSNGKDLPFWQTKEDQGVQVANQNCLRGIRSRSGHMITFVDKGTEDADKIVLQTQVNDENVYDQPALGNVRSATRSHIRTALEMEVPDGEIGTHCISLDMTPEKEHILISDKDGSLVVKFDSQAEALILYSTKDIVMHAENNIHVLCENLKVESKSDTLFKAGKRWIQESGTVMEITSGGTMTLKGGPDIQLNP